MIKSIKWNGFLEDAEEEYPKEICAWIYTENPYSNEESWHIVRVKEVSKDWDGDGFYEGWTVDVKDLARVKKIAKKNKWIRLGNVHTHSMHESYDKAFGGKTTVIKNGYPSEKDLSEATKYRDVVRVILGVGYDGKLCSVHSHDPNGKAQPIIADILHADMFLKGYKNVVSLETQSAGI